MKATKISMKLRNCNENSARNFNKVILQDEEEGYILLTLYFSYETVIAYQEIGKELVATQNIWGPTTGKHLNWISDKEDRIPYDEFKEKLSKVVAPIVFMKEKEEV